MPIKISENQNTNAQSPSRKIYLDNLRCFTVILVMVYHVCYLFNGVGVIGAIPNAKNIGAFDVISYVVYPWFMVLLFLIAGMSARYSLQSRSNRQFIKERTIRLLVPSTLGLFMIHWITGYLNIKIGGGLSYIPAPLIYPISVLSGTGPLWFIQMLYLFSCLLILFRKIDKKDQVWFFCAKCDIIVIFLLSLVIWGASQILNMPVLTMYRFGIYFAAFFIGYYIFSHEEILKKIEALRIPLMVVSLCGAFFYTLYYFGENYTSPSCLQSIYTNIYLWIVILALIGCFRHSYNNKSALSDYLHKTSFGFYILHYPALMILCYLLCFYLDLPAVCNYILALAGEFVLTYILYEIIRRIPVIRFLVLGIHGGFKTNLPDA